jgi:hypothetical protein
MTVLTSFIQSIRNAASYNKHELAAPWVILWPDEERLWTQCSEPLRASLEVMAAIVGEIDRFLDRGLPVYVRRHHRHLIESYADQLYRLGYS